MRDGSEVGGVGLDQYAVVRDRANYSVATPVFERHNSAERDVPSGVERSMSKFDGTGKAMEHAEHAFPTGFAHHRRRIVIRITGVHDDWPGKAFGEL